MRLTSITDEARIALANLTDFASGMIAPSVRLGVTGLSRAGKTVFITALVHNLVHGGRLPLFSAAKSGRLAGAHLEPQPDDAVPRFDFEAHVERMVVGRVWPDSTRRISELRVTINYESASHWNRRLGRGQLHLDIVDYPGEWLLDLPLLARDYARWSAEAVELARLPARAAIAGPFLAALEGLDPDGAEDETVARRLAALFTDYLRAARADTHALSTLPPGRFLMPGDLDGSPALTFAPLDVARDRAALPKSLAAMMERRYDAYRDIVVRPFFRDHFARLDRQVVLVDALQALNAGPAAVEDLRHALGDILEAFRPGRASWLSSILTRRIDRILFAATKADHLHRSSHDRLEAILRRLVGSAMERAAFAGAAVDVVALAAVRATREATVTRDGERLPAILGVPAAGETIGDTVFDGTAEAAIFPGDLPADPDVLFRQVAAGAAAGGAPAATASLAPDVSFVRFRPPRLERTAEGVTLSLPHIRLDRVLEFLIGDRLT
ncbi:YcjX family GTP-binding protein [Prosthecodimorpha staleyi]|uniref:YcjX family protein n=1 Tax=Prosthecodimorpha staleyi TaxID=2840188 RepID=A0A947D4H7_9HYPH|nr:YcjX family protein [Prosthecodimorpha staleyi]MBT9290620.1 YcjX family protein [Prosthecodimorpha staleyi]